MKPMIEVKDLWKSYGSLQVLKGLDLQVFEGETVVILGRSGVGKSVLLKQIIGLEVPDAGEIFIHGKKIGPDSPPDMVMGMLFQGAALFDSMNIEENVAFYLRQHDKELSEKEIMERVDEALHLVNLDGVNKKIPSELSGGMRKRAGLARLIAYRPHILLYDEPTTGLDPITSMQINELINEIQKKLKSTSIVVTHDIKSALEIGDRFAFHEDGKIVFIAGKYEFSHSTLPVLQSFFQNAIVTRELLEENRA